MKLIVFGTGSASGKIYNSLDETIDIVAISDNDSSKWGTLWQGVKVIPPKEIQHLEYDYILICSMYTKEIIEGLIRNGISRDKMIPYYNNYYTSRDREKEVNIKKQIFKKPNIKDIALLSRRNSGCNCRALYHNIPNHIKENFLVSLVNLDEYIQNYHNYEVGFTTNIEGRNFKCNLHFEIWHGFPLKTLGLLEKNCTENYSNADNGFDYILSYSNFYSFVISSVFKMDITKFVVTGMPRNDFLISSNSRENIAKLIDREVSNKKIIFYVPTFRRRNDKSVYEGSKILSEIKEFNEIEQFAKQNNLYFIVKKHPVEGDEIPQMDYENVFFIEDGDLVNINIDFYEILGGSDLLITDYSSVYFDYLLLNKPIIFWMRDKVEYETQRGFLFENIETLMPGSIVNDTNKLLPCIEENLRNPNLFLNEREHIKKLVHTYTDFNSSRRVWEVFSEIYRMNSTNH